MDLSTDPLHNLVHRQVKRSIQLLVEAECWSPALQLVYAGIDTMAWLGAPPTQDNVTRKDFIAWASRYVQFPGREQLTGEDLYGARCAILHQHAAESDLSRQGKCRIVGYYVGDSAPPVIFKAKVDPMMVLVSVTGVVDAFFRGVDSSLVDLFADPKKARVAEQRLQSVTIELPYDSGNK